jgi:hypothetical protein
MIKNRLLTISAMVLMNAVPLSAQIIPKEPIVAPTLYTGPPPTGFRVTSSTPASVSFSWGASTGAVSYQLMRTASAGAAWTYLAPNPIASTTLAYNDQSGIDYRSSYIYRLQVNYSSGPSGYIDLPVTLPRPVNPTGLTAKQIGSQTVTLTWNPTDNPAMLFGSGLPQNGVSVTGASYTVNNLTLGQNSWTIGTFYQPGNISTPATEFPSTSATVVKWMGNYRISLIGLSVNNPSDDDILDADGKGDEIMPYVYMQTYDQASGNTLSPAVSIRGATHGQNQGGKFGQRVMAGTATNKGGLIKGDIFPAGLLQGALASSPVAQGSFPIKIFEGILTRDREALVIWPSLWEIDDTPDRWFMPYMTGMPARTRDALSPLTAAGTKLRQTLDAPSISEIRGEDWFKMDSWGTSATGDRPIGIERASSPDDRGGFYDRIIVLNQRKIEEFLAQPPRIPGLPAGVIGLSFPEGGVLHITGTPNPMSWNFPANYTLYLRVETVP